MKFDLASSSTVAPTRIGAGNSAEFLVAQQVAAAQTDVVSISSSLSSSKSWALAAQQATWPLAVLGEEQMFLHPECMPAYLAGFNAAVAAYVGDDEAEHAVQAVLEPGDFSTPEDASWGTTTTTATGYCYY